MSTRSITILKINMVNMSIIFLITFILVLFLLSGEMWKPWSKWSSECDPKCWKGEGKHNKVPRKTRVRVGSTGGSQIDTKECDELEICSAGKEKSRNF